MVNERRVHVTGASSRCPHPLQPPSAREEQHLEQSTAHTEAVADRCPLDRCPRSGRDRLRRIHGQDQAGNREALRPETPEQDLQQDAVQLRFPLRGDELRQVGRESEELQLPPAGQGVRRPEGPHGGGEDQGPVQGPRPGEERRRVGSPGQGVGEARRQGHGDLRPLPVQAAPADLRALVRQDLHPQRDQQQQGLVLRRPPGQGLQSRRPRLAVRGLRRHLRRER